MLEVDLEFDNKDITPTQEQCKELLFEMKEKMALIREENYFKALKAETERQDS